MTISSTYTVAKLSDYVYYQEGPGIRNYQNTTEGVKFLNIRCFVNGRLDTASMKKVAESEARGKYKHFLLDAGDYVVSSSGTLGRIAEVYPEDLPVMLNTSTIRFRPIDSSLLDRLYLRYFLESEVFQQQVKSLATGSVQLNYGPSHLAFVEMPLPPIEIQKAIGGVLDSLARKIDLNSEMSKTLESLAQAIFKSWFIDFDPVKAKMAGERPMGMDSATASLFPNSMAESELGVIPQGWEWKTIGDIAHVIDCLHSKKPQLLSEGYPYLQLDTISDSGVLYFENAGRISKEDYEKWTSRIEVEGGDCLITNVGRVGAVSQVPRHFKAAIGRNITAIRPKNSKLHQSFLIVALLSDFMKREISKNTDSGTILEALNVKNIPKLLIPGPSTELLLEFAKVCDPIQSQIQELQAMNVNLRKIRNSLLPRLISGELQIPKEMLAS